MEKLKVLLPVDGMRNSAPAEDYVIELNDRTPLDVTVVNVFDTSQLEGRGLNIGLQDKVRESHMHFMKKILDEVMDKLAAGGVQAAHRIVSGKPGNVICNLAMDENFELLVISDSGLSDFQDWLAGSVTHYVLYRCTVPVVLVKHRFPKTRGE